MRFFALRCPLLRLFFNHFRNLVVAWNLMRCVGVWESEVMTEHIVRLILRDNLASNKLWMIGIHMNCIAIYLLRSFANFRRRIMYILNSEECQSRRTKKS